MAALSPAPESYIQSILDTDLYKLRQYAILELYPNVDVKYRFTNRGGTRFTRDMHAAVLEAIQHLETLSLTPAERAFLERRCPYFPPSYLDYLSSFRFRPATQVRLTFVPLDLEGQGEREGDEYGSFELEVEGTWLETILYEVPLMSILSEAYFTHVDTHWDYVGQLELARTKGRALVGAGCLVSEFGSRRRRTYRAHDVALRGLVAADREAAAAAAAGQGEGEGKGKRGRLAGTSNVHFACKYDLVPIGTIAHEMVMGIAALEGYEGSNGRTMDAWDKVYPTGALSIALTDTFTTKPFFDDFVADPERARRWKGLRQDSGDPLKFIPVAREAFERVGADPRKKVVVFSDSLDVARCIELKKAADEAGIGCSFGVGTHLTNDFRRVEHPVVQDKPGAGPVRTEGESSKALNMVIKLYSIAGQPCVKISDELTKNTGDPEAVALVKQRFGLEAHGGESTQWGPTV